MQWGQLFYETNLTYQQKSHQKIRANLNVYSLGFVLSKFNSLTDIVYFYYQTMT